MQFWNTKISLTFLTYDDASSSVYTSALTAPRLGRAFRIAFMGGGEASSSLSTSPAPPPDATGDSLPAPDALAVSCSWNTEDEN